MTAAQHVGCGSRITANLILNVRLNVHALQGILLFGNVARSTENNVVLVGARHRLP